MSPRARLDVCSRLGHFFPLPWGQMLLSCTWSGADFTDNSVFAAQTRITSPAPPLLGLLCSLPTLFQIPDVPFSSKLLQNTVKRYECYKKANLLPPSISIKAQGLKIKSPLEELFHLPHLSRQRWQRELRCESPPPHRHRPAVIASCTAVNICITAPGSAPGQLSAQVHSAPSMGTQGTA